VNEAFHGWNARAAWLNTCLARPRRRDFEKIAIVGAPAWEEWCGKLASLLIAGEIKIFTRDELRTRLAARLSRACPTVVRAPASWPDSVRP
jgi:hypothetical protein